MFDATEASQSARKSGTHSGLQAVAAVGKEEGWVSGVIFDMVESTRNGLLGFLDQA
jgi:hypothetical protein